MNVGYTKGMRRDPKKPSIGVEVLFELVFHGIEGLLLLIIILGLLFAVMAQGAPPIIPGWAGVILVMMLWKEAVTDLTGLSPSQRPRPPPGA